MTTACLTSPEPSDPAKVTLRGPADLIAATPYLLGFHPSESLVVVAFHGKRLGFAARGDLPDPTQPTEFATAALLDVVTRQQADAVAIVGYGPAERVDPLLAELWGAADSRNLYVKDVLRVHQGRWWSILCDDPGCCPSEGTSLELTTSEVSARLAFEGLTAAPSREDRERELTPVAGPELAGILAATGRAEHRLAELLMRLPEDEWAETLLVEGTAAIEAGIERYAQEGARLDDDDMAWLIVLVGHLPVRDAAWQAVTHEPAHLRLWSDATRRAEPGLAAPAACLLAFTAWRSGDGVLARLALERALVSDPSYPLARLMMEGLQRGEPPSSLTEWGTPAWAETLRRTLSKPGTDPPPRRKRRRGRRGGGDKRT